MKRTRFLKIVLAAGALTLSALAADEALPKGFDVMDRFVEASGGKKIYQKHRSEVASMTMEFVGKGIKGTGTRYTDVSNNSYETITLEGVGKVDAGVYNGIAWETNPITGPRLLSGAEKASRLRDAQFNAPLHARDLYKTAETVGLESVDGEECYKVVLTPLEGKPETDYFSRKSGLLKKKSMIVSSPMGDLPVEVFVGEYKDFDGILTPRRISQKMMGNEITVSADDVKYNVEIAKDRYEPPAEIRKLMAK